MLATLKSSVAVGGHGALIEWGGDLSVLFQDEAQVHVMGGGHEPAGSEGELDTDDAAPLRLHPGMIGTVMYDC